jgi:hypothetical protein
MALTIVFVLLFAIAIARGIHNGSTSSQEYLQSLIDKKPKIEYIIPVKRDPLGDRNILNYVDYINEKRFEEETERMLDELGVETMKE